LIIKCKWNGDLFVLRKIFCWCKFKKIYVNCKVVLKNFQSPIFLLDNVDGIRLVECISWQHLVKFYIIWESQWVLFNQSTIKCSTVWHQTLQLDYSANCHNLYILSRNIVKFKFNFLIKHLFHFNFPRNVEYCGNLCITLAIMHFIYQCMYSQKYW
jgi:hypothetical protein